MHCFSWIQQCFPIVSLGRVAMFGRLLRLVKGVLYVGRSTVPKKTKNVLNENLQNQILFYSE